MNRYAIGACVVVAVMLVIAIGGAIFTSAKMNQTADIHGTSAGRSGDPKLNTVDDRPSPKSTGASETTGAVPNIK